MSTKREVEQQYSVPEVAALLKVDESTVWRLIRRKRITPVRKLGRRITRVPASAVNRFLDAQTVSE